MAQVPVISETGSKRTDSALLWTYMSRGLSRFLQQVNFIASFPNNSDWHKNTGTPRDISTCVRWLASTYIRQLRSGLPQCCMHEDILGMDGAILPGGSKQDQVHKQPRIRSRPQAPAWNERC